MEQSSLNLAHQQLRRAEAYLKRRKFEEAIRCHVKAIDYLEEALQRTTMPRSRESINMQRDYHLNQIRIVESKRDQYETMRKALEMEKMHALANKDGNGGESLKLTAYKMLRNLETLLATLGKQDSISDSDSKSDVSTEANTTEDGQQNSAEKPKKDTQMIVDELVLVHHNLHTMVLELAHQLEVSNSHRNALLVKVKNLEAKSRKTENTQFNRHPSISDDTPPSPEPTTARASGVQDRATRTTNEMPDLVSGPSASGADGCKFKIIPEFRNMNISNMPLFREVEIPERPPLPPLPPLEMPDLDYSLFTNSASRLPPGGMRRMPSPKSDQECDKDNEA